jgi:SOS-response transcriptional repressor LexA
VSIPTIYQHVTALEKKGFLLRTKNKKRDFEVVEKPVPKDAIKSPAFEAFTIPILGAATAGSAVNFAEECTEGYLKVSKKLLKPKKGLFAIRINGNSMNKASKKGTFFSSGNFAVIDPDNTNPDNNAYVLSVIDGLANIKKFQRDTHGIRLVSESTEDIHKPIHISSSDNYMVNGEVVAVIEK